MRHLIAFVAVIVMLGTTDKVLAQTTPQKLPKGSAVLELLLNEDATVKVDGKDVGQERTFTFNDLKAKTTLPVRVGVQFSHGPEEQRFVEMEEGKRVRLAMASPSAMPEQLLAGITSSVMTIALSGDGRFLAAGHDNKLAVLWDLQQGKVVRSFVGHAGPVLSVAISPNNKWLATASEDGKVIIWELATGKKERTLTGHAGNVFSVQFSPDGTKLVTAGADHLAILWDADSGRRLVTFEGHDGEVWSATFSPDGQKVATASEDKTSILWNAANGERIRDFVGDPDHVKKIRFSPDGKYLLTASYDNNAFLWDTATGKKLRTYGRHASDMWDAVFTPDLSRVASAGWDYLIFVYDMEKGTKLRTLTGHAASLTSMAMNGDGKLLYTGSFDGTVRIWDMVTGVELAALVAGENEKVWEVVTPEGLFDGSADGRSMVDFRYQTDPEKQVAKYFKDSAGATVRDRLVGGRETASERFFKGLYFPGLLAAVVGGERPLPQHSPVQGFPPLLKIVSPKAGKAAGTETTVVVEATDQNGGIFEPAIFDNGARVYPKLDKKETETGAIFTFTLPLTLGKNRIEVHVANMYDSWEAEPATVDLVASQPKERKGRLFVLAVGIDDYREAGMKLKFAAKDAQAFDELLRTRGRALYEKVESVTIIDGDASKKRIEDQLRILVAQTLPQDTIVVYLAGRAVQFGDHLYMLPQEFNSTDDKNHNEKAYAAVALSLDDIASSISQGKALHRLIIADLSSPAGLAKEPPPLTTRFGLRGLAERLTFNDGVFSLTALVNGNGGIKQELNNRLLTYVVLNGLKAISEGPLADQVVPSESLTQPVQVNGLFDFVDERLSSLVHTAGSVGFAASTQTGDFPLIPLAIRP